MRSTFLKILLLAGVVLSLFILLLRVYVQYTTHDTPAQIVEKKVSIPVIRVEKNATHSKIVMREKGVSASQIAALSGADENRSLEQQYHTIASEIADFTAAKSAEENLTQKEGGADENKFVSHCPVPIQKKITPPLQPFSRKHLQKKKKKAIRKKRLPRVVIIMDDVCSVEQGRLIKSLPVEVTPSIFPVTSDHPDTQRVASMFRCFMIHTPMEALNYPREEENTLRADDTFERIDRKIAAIKRDFPKLIAINNHTGSRFTADDAAMDRLFCALRKYGIHFIDSRTCPDSVAVSIGRLHGERVFSRNVFLDNVDDVDAILARLRETVHYAKKHRLAIAICHPRPATFEALKRSKTLFRGVEVVGVDQLYR